MKKLLLYCFLLCTPIVMLNAEEKNLSNESSIQEKDAVSTTADTSQEEQSPQLQESPESKKGIPFAVKNTTDGVINFIKSSVKSMGELPGVLSDNVSQGLQAEQQHEQNFGFTGR
ncbi:MAG: hypothetical protein RBU23_08750 [Candidatus Auribacterota bacterium]|nr:hypothetical protein [Candidatus Auribacterota bacterium]